MQSKFPALYSFLVLSLWPIVPLPRSVNHTIVNTNAYHCGIIWLGLLRVGYVEIFGRSGLDTKDSMSKYQHCTIMFGVSCMKRCKKSNSFCLTRNCFISHELISLWNDIIKFLNAATELSLWWDFKSQTVSQKFS